MVTTIRFLFFSHATHECEDLVIFRQVVLDLESDLIDCCWRETTASEQRVIESYCIDMEASIGPGVLLHLLEFIDEGQKIKMKRPT